MAESATPQRRLQVRLVADSSCDQAGISLEEMHDLLRREIREESKWYRTNFRMPLTRWEEEAIHRFLARRLLGDQVFRLDLHASRSRESGG